MADNASRFVGNIPANYDAGLGPNIFSDYADDMAHRAAALRPSRVLELAAGTGIVSRKLRDAVSSGVPLVVTDLNASMLDVARSKFREGENVEFASADAMKLCYPDAHFDLVVCQFGVMFFPDKVTSFQEALRVLRTGGKYLFNTWGSMSENPFAQIAHQVASEFFPVDPPGFYRVPFSYADPAKVAGDLRAAGFTEIKHESVALRKQVDDLSAFARGLVFGNPLIDEINSRGGVNPDEVVAAVERRFRIAWGAERAIMPLKANVFVASRD
jgi:ubiquinone/menaquinone biosynthesis C-methylase UbiE